MAAFCQAPRLNDLIQRMHKTIDARRPAGLALKAEAWSEIGVLFTTFRLWKVASKIWDSNTALDKIGFRNASLARSFSDQSFSFHPDFWGVRNLALEKIFN